MNLKLCFDGQGRLEPRSIIVIRMQIKAFPGDRIHLIFLVKVKFRIFMSK